MSSQHSRCFDSDVVLFQRPCGAASARHSAALSVPVARLLDGTLISTCRRSGTANRSNYNGKHKKHGLLFLALTDQAGNLIWISSARRGAASEITAARQDQIAGRLRTAGLGALADLGFTGLDPDPEDPVIITGYKATRTRKTTPAQRQANQALSAARAPIEHGFSDLKNLRSLTRLRINPSKATALLRALLVLTRQHTTRRQMIMTYAQPPPPARAPPTPPTPGPRPANSGWNNLIGEPNRITLPSGSMRTPSC